MSKSKKLIEVALPLESINKESAKEKSIRHGHPSTLHLWWARRPLAAARAVIFASIIDDPSSFPEKFPTEKEQKSERQRLFKLIEEMVLWENTTNDELLGRCYSEIRRACMGEVPILLDPFAGGGTIPLEGQRLGLQVCANDLNPVAVMINKATIEIPPKFSDKAPVNPKCRSMNDDAYSWNRAKGMAADIRYYGNLMKEMAYSKIDYAYPNVKIIREDGKKENKNIIAWIWARIGKCPNPACGCEIPFASSFIISKKTGNEAWVEPIYNGKKVSFKVHYGKCIKEKASNKMGRSALFKCPCCGAVTTDEYVKKIGKSNQIYSKLMAIVAEGDKKKVFIDADINQEMAAQVTKPDDYPKGTIPTNPRWFSPPSFGMMDYSDLFSNRQLLALTTFSDLLPVIEQRVMEDAIDAGWSNDFVHLTDGGTGATAYGEAMRVYMAFIIDRETNYSSMLNGWSGDFIIQTFGRQALPMVWDYAESNPFSNSTGNWDGAVNWVADAVENFPASSPGEAHQSDARSDNYICNAMISTDPPYYDNIGYADLSDYFYIWLRRGIKNVYPDLFNTLMVPKQDELVATPYHFGGNAEKAKTFFENGMKEACERLYKYANDNFPITIYYAYKQSETNNKTGTISSGWETMLAAIIDSGLVITGTWPIHTERETGLKAHVNALASSIVLVCRKRKEDAPQTTRRNLITNLRKDLRPALKRLQESNIAPVDLAQSAIGPGMAVFSKYSQVLEADGTPMTVRSALQIINEEIDHYFNEQVGGMDTASRFCVDLYTQYAYNDIKYGEAEVLANAKGTSIPMIVSQGVVYAKAGNAHLLERKDLPKKVDPNETNIWLLTQQITHAMEEGGIEACAKIVANMFGSNAEHAKDLAYRLYTIAEQKKWASETHAYNSLVVAWPDIQLRAAEMKASTPEQLDLFKMGYLDE